VRSDRFRSYDASLQKASLLKGAQVSFDLGHALEGCARSGASEDSARRSEPLFFAFQDIVKAEPLQHVIPADRSQLVQQQARAYFLRRGRAERTGYSDEISLDTRLRNPMGQGHQAGQEPAPFREGVVRVDYIQEDNQLRTRR
jgi:hypothetical protein